MKIMNSMATSRSKGSDMTLDPVEYLWEVEEVASSDSQIQKLVIHCYCGTLLSNYKTFARKGSLYVGIMSWQDEQMIPDSMVKLVIDTSSFDFGDFFDELGRSEIDHGLRDALLSYRTRFVVAAEGYGVAIHSVSLGEEEWEAEPSDDAPDAGALDELLQQCRRQLDAVLRLGDIVAR
jgi:hypothetical protein